MKTLALLLVATGCSLAGFIPSVRVDHENRPSHGCYHSDITVAPGGLYGEPVYVAIEDDSFAGIVVVRSDIYFQKSDDAGRTWLSEDVLVRRGALFACYPDITTDRDGNIYIVYTERPSGTSGHFYCVRSTDGGSTWSAPVKVDDNTGTVKAGWARVAVDTAGDLFCAWNEDRTGRMRIWSSRSTDQGATWSASVRVDDDTVPADCFHTDVFVQPGTSHYLVTSTAPYWVRQGYINSNSAFYRSTDRGATWSAGVVLDTFSGYCGQPHVVADSVHIVCDFSGSSSGNQMKTESRTLLCGPDTWGSTIAVTDLDTLYSSYLNGGKLAIDHSGRVHACLMVCDLAQAEYNTYYAYSTDFGSTWAAREIVNDVTTGSQADPNIAADSAGYAYLIWQDQRNRRDEVWFSTNNSVGVAEAASLRPAGSLRCSPAVFRDRTRIELALGTTCACQVIVYDATGRVVQDLPLKDGLTWDGSDASGSRLPAGSYVVRAGDSRSRVVLLPLR